MNILIIGNGFDLAHKLPTTYSDFIDFITKIEMTKIYRGNLLDFKTNHIDNTNLQESIKGYIIEAFNTKKILEHDITSNENPLIKEIYENLEYNTWFEFFKELCHKNLMKGVNWIDFESEISYIIEFIDRFQDNLYLPMNINSNIANEKVKIFIRTLNSSKFEEPLIEKNEKYTPTFSDMLNKTYYDLRRFIRCMEIYFSDYVEKLEIDVVSPDISNINTNIHNILTFNYTHTFENNYNFDNNKIHYIHGETRSNRDERKNNMVLGIDEYRGNAEKDYHTNYNLYKKFTQRVINETGFKYRNWIDTINMLPSNTHNLNYVYIFGHSLDVTDKDILRELIMNKAVVTTVFYHNKQQQSQQIANLVKMIGQDNFINKINSVPPSILFNKQQDMKKK